MRTYSTVDHVVSTVTTEARSMMKCGCGSSTFARYPNSPRPSLLTSYFELSCTVNGVGNTTRAGHVFLLAMTHHCLLGLKKLIQQQRKRCYPVERSTSADLVVQ